MTAKKTLFYDRHLDLGGKMVDYAGWVLPVQYQGIIEEVHRVREKAGIFDVSHMGEILVEGRGALEFLQKVLTNDAARMKTGRAMYSPVCYDDGGTVDDILVYCYSREKFLLVVNAANTAGDFDWFSRHCPRDVTLRDLSEEMAQIALQGPNSGEILLAVADSSILALKYYQFLPEVPVAGIRCLVSRTGYTGEDGFEIYCNRQEAREVWGELWSAGREDGLGLAPVGLGARDVLRLEAAMPLYGHELSPKITPLAAGLERFVSFDKGTDFIGREALLRQKREGPAFGLCGLVTEGRGIAREGYRVRAGSVDIGWVSSGSWSPTLNKAIALAFVRPEFAVAGTEVQVVIRDREHGARVVQTPFYRREKQWDGRYRKA
jgi:aminomethyltransferase